MLPFATEDALLQFQYHKPHLVLSCHIPPTRATTKDIETYTSNPNS